MCGGGGTEEQSASCSAHHFTLWCVLSRSPQAEYSLLPPTGVVCTARPAASDWGSMHSMAQCSAGRGYTDYGHGPAQGSAGKVRGMRGQTVFAIRESVL